MGEDPLTVQFHWVDFWLLIHDILLGFMADTVAHQLGNFIREFIEYDTAATQLGYKRIMRIRVRVDVRKPLKRKKRIALKNGESDMVKVFAPIRAIQPQSEYVFNWDISLRAQPRKNLSWKRNVNKWENWGSIPKDSVSVKDKGKSTFALGPLKLREMDQHHDGFEEEMVAHEKASSPITNSPITHTGQPGVMKLLSWNVWGLGRPRTANRLRHMLRDINLTVVFVIEMKLKSCNMEKVRCKCGFPNGIDVDSDGRSGGLSLGWNSDCKITLRSFSRRHINNLLRNKEGFIMGLGFKGHNLVRSVVIAEAIAVLHGLQFALDLGFTNVILENHSLGMPRIWRGIFLIVDFNSLREKEMGQPAMAVEGLRADEDSFWVEDAPLKVLEVADSDRQFSRPP
ncbi:hypothetical protein Godav_024682 [Gossypium davidsonii]|uniref:RNase H type-1 domain-containing protein n=1 Tax=Gossypium davidsonii TaxID=34287 RepID=A0A7J8TCW7_GOSDV|nr:hypothetical protein [Gossypium davidsonii]